MPDACAAFNGYKRPLQMQVLSSGRPIQEVSEQMKELAYQQTWGTFAKDTPEWPPLMRLAEKLDPSFKE